MIRITSLLNKSFIVIALILLCTRTYASGCNPSSIPLEAGTWKDNVSGLTIKLEVTSRCEEDNKTTCKVTPKTCYSNVFNMLIGNGYSCDKKVCTTQLSSKLVYDSRITYKDSSATEGKLWLVDINADRIKSKADKLDSGWIRFSFNAPYRNYTVRDQSGKQTWFPKDGSYASGSGTGIFFWLWIKADSDNKDKLTAVLEAVSESSPNERYTPSGSDWNTLYRE